MNGRAFVSIAGLAVAGLLLAGSGRRLLADHSVWPPDDFVEYWCAGWLNLRGENPYDPVRMYELDKEIGWDIGQAVMMWNPPWTLSLVMPLGLLPWRVAQFVWLGAKVAALVFCADRIWRTYGGPADRVWVAWALTFAFLPTLIALNVGQISPFLLLGATLFVLLERAGYPFWAGAACVLLAAKPHLAYLFWIAVAADAVSRQRLSIVLGGVAGGAVCCVWPLAENPAVFDQYFVALRENPPAQWMSVTSGTLLRAVFGAEHFWLQFVPMLPGFVWFAFDWARHARDWDWAERMPWLLFVSFVTAPYGAWPYDLVVLLLPLLRLAAKLAQDRRSAGWLLPLTCLAAVDLGMLGLNLAQVYSVWFVWVAPALLALAVWTARRIRAVPSAPEAVS